MSKNAIAVGLLLAVLLTLVSGCGASSPTPDEQPLVPVAPDSGAVINDTCPRSGEPVASDSTTEYRGVVVGFCNTHCRDDFAANVSERPDDTAFFDAILAQRETAGDRLRSLVCVFVNNAG